MAKRIINLSEVHYTNTKLLRQFLSPSGTMMPRAKTGVTAKVQRKVSREIKRARQLALLPYTSLM